MSVLNNVASHSVSDSGAFDVIICGGGLAGLTLARQLRQTCAHRSILLIDRLARPLPEATFKVGESTVEVGANYLGHKLKLLDYFQQHHLTKMGLRFFFGDANGPFQERPEFGLSMFPTTNSYQIDRGVLENDLRGFIEEGGVTLLEGVKVQDIILADDDQPHEIFLTHGNNPGPQKFRARWVVDAMGRTRFLQKQLGLSKKGRGNFSSVWFRLPGRIDVNDLVPRHEKTWHNRVSHNNRFFSTNHLMGRGYWVWLIPLGSDYTSVGIVAQEDIHPSAEFNNHELAMQWLTRQEPTLAEYLKDRRPSDFMRMRKYSYSSVQVFSTQRWACVGEAGVFADPFYSPGTDMIGFGNTITNDLIERDFRGELTPDLVTAYNQFYLGLNETLTNNIQLGYPLFGNAVVATTKIIWDTASAWAFLCPQMFHSLYIDQEKVGQIRPITASFFSLRSSMQRLFLEWAAHSPGRLSFDFLDYLTLDFLKDLRARNLQTEKTLAALLADQKENMERFEELAQVLFLLAIEDVMPECLEQFQKPIWLNAWRISLNPARWEADGLFQPRNEPRDFSEMRRQMRSQFRLQQSMPI